MMRIPISFDMILASYCTEKEEIRIKIRESRSRFKLAPLRSFEWALMVAVKATPDPLPESIEDRVAEFARRSTVWIQARQGSRGFWNSSLLSNVPQEVLDTLRESQTSRKT